MEVPANLITTSWNLMQLHKPSTTDPTKTAPTRESTSQSCTGSGQKVYVRHMQLQDKLLKVRIDASISADGLAVENEYSKEVGNIEMNRYRALHSCPSDTVKTTINAYHDQERLCLADKTEVKLDNLIEKAELMRQAAQKANWDKTAMVSTASVASDPVIQGRLPTQKASTDGASLLLQPIEENDPKMTAVRKLKFNTSEDHAGEDEDDEDNDYLNGSVNSEDFEIDEIDVETVDHEEDKNTISTEPETNFSNPGSNKSDLLQQCIEESGLEALAEVERLETVSSTTSPVTSECSQTISTELRTNVSSSAFKSSNKLPSNSLPTMNTQTELRQGSHTTTANRASAFRKAETKPASFGPETFGTPQNLSLKFTQPDHINMALSEIGKLCGGPSITFTPELRREMTTSFTPEVPGFSPFSYPTPSGNHSTSLYRPAKTWNSPIETVSDFSSRPESGQKRKSPCDEEESAVHINANHFIKPEQSTEHSVKNQEVSSATELETCATLNNPMFRTHRMLTSEATNILNHWYSTHMQYPYPNDEEVKQLSQLTGITGRQVKKWMANKRVRCFNTLSITGNQHPIKFKYNGKGRKKQPVVEKENCDSTTQEKKVNYSLLSEEAKLALNNWYEQHKDNPYPSEEEKQELATACNISVNQVKSWFANKRNRTNNTRRQVPNYFISKFPEYSNMVQYVGQRREEARMIKRRKLNQVNMYIQPSFYF